MSISAEPAPRGGRNGLLVALRRRVRLIAGLAAMAVAFVVVPDQQTPGWGEFVDQAVVIGCASGAADVNATSKPMRCACLAHGVVAFFFNAIILAPTIAIGAGLI